MQCQIDARCNPGAGPDIVILNKNAVFFNHCRGGSAAQPADYIMMGRALSAIQQA